MKCEFKHNGDMGMGPYGLRIYDSMGGHIWLDRQILSNSKSISNK